MRLLADLGGWPAVLNTLVGGRHLDREQAAAAMSEILAGEATPAQLAGFVVALRMKGETVEELGGLLDAMLDVAVRVPLPNDVRLRAVDVVGTGGDRSHSINVSTLASFVVAGAGVPVCKHGNRAASSRCGAADLLEVLGVVIDLGSAGVARCVRDAGIGFCLAPRFHPALRHAGPPRRELGVPTAFNVLGPLANPARVVRQVLGVADESVAERMLQVLAAHGSQHVVVVHGADGLDELTTTGASTVHELRAGQVTTWKVDPAELGLEIATAEQLRGGSPEDNAAFARGVLGGQRGPHRDIVVLNAAAGLYVGGKVDSLAAGVALAGDVIDGGSAERALDLLVEVSAQAAGAESP